MAEGTRWCQRVARSYAWASESTRASASGGPLICRPIGIPARVNPHGTLIVGMPYTLNGNVLRIMPDSSGGDALAAAIATGGAIDVGVTITSTFSK